MLMCLDVRGWRHFRINVRSNDEFGPESFRSRFEMRCGELRIGRVEKFLSAAVRLSEPTGSFEKDFRLDGSLFTGF